MNGVQKEGKRIANGRMKISDICWKINGESFYPGKTNIIKLKSEE